MRQDKQQNENNQQKKAGVRIVLRVICIIGLFCCAAWLIYYFVSLRSNSEQVDGLKDQYVVVAPSVEPESTEPEPEPEPQPEPTTTLFGDREYPNLTDYEVPELEIDFAGLQEVNPDVYAWIYVPDTNIDYPVLQRQEDANYYLERDMEGNRNVAGAIFTQFYNSKDWTDNHTVIYGHNMRNKSMFATLHNFEDSQFFEDHPYVYIYTPEYTLVYQVFGAYEYPDVHLILNYNMNDHDSFGQYLEDVLALDGINMNFDRSLEVTADDRIITLSTCVGGKSTYRYLVQAKLTAVGRNADAEEAADDGEITGTADS